MNHLETIVQDALIAGVIITFLFFSAIIILARMKAISDSTIKSLMSKFLLIMRAYELGGKLIEFVLNIFNAITGFIIKFISGIGQTIVDLFKGIGAVLKGFGTLIRGKNYSSASDAADPE